MFGKVITLTSAAICTFTLTSCRSAPVVEQPAPEPAYACRYATGPMTLDGKLDEAAWKQAEVISRFYPFTSATDPALSPTRVRVLRDDKNLYVGFECEDDDIWSFSTQDDAELWNGDVAEFFIKADAEGKSFYEFVIAPSGALFDALHASQGGGGFRRFGAWSSGAKVATTVDGTDGDWSDQDHGYTVELAVPLAVIKDKLPICDENTWTFGAFRYNYSKSFDDAQLLMSIPEAPKWGFHYYPGYRPMVFETMK